MDGYEKKMSLDRPLEEEIIGDKKYSRIEIKQVFNQLEKYPHWEYLEKVERIADRKSEIEEEILALQKELDALEGNK